MTTQEEMDAQAGAGLRAAVVANVAEMLRHGHGRHAAAVANALVDVIDRDAIGPLAAEVSRLQAVLDTLRARLEAARAESNAFDDQMYRDGRERGLTVALSVLAELHPNPSQEDGRA